MHQTKHNNTQEEPDIDALYRMERRRRQALAAIGDASREIAGSADYQGTLNLVMQKAAETLPMDAGVLFLIDEPGRQFKVAVSHNLTPERAARIRIAAHEGVPGWVVDHSAPLIIEDAALDRRVHPLVVKEGVQSLLAVPLASRERVIGVLNLFCQTGTNVFDSEAQQLAQVYADQTAVFIENARLMDELRQAAAQLEARVERRTEQLHEKQAQIVRTEKMATAGRLAASVAHEVNNPLQAIALHLQLIAADGLDEQATDSLHLVQHELGRIAVIVQRLLDFQRPRPREPQVWPVELLLDKVLNLARKQLQRANILVSTGLPGDLAPVFVTAGQIEQVFLNLILNAVEAMPGGGRLRITAVSSGAKVLISFSDSGAGMSEEALKHLFEPFYSTKHSGSGMGLAVSREIVCEHGGALTATNQPGQGATFTISLPLARESLRQDDDRLLSGACAQ